MEALCRLLEYLGMLAGFLRLFTKLFYRGRLAFFKSRSLEVRIHLIGLVELAFYSNFEQSLDCHFTFGIDEIEMRKCMSRFLMSRFLEEAGDIFVAEFARDFGEVQILAIRHRFTSKRSHQVVLGSCFSLLTHDFGPPN